MDVLLVRPSYRLLFGRFHLPRYFPLGLGYIGAYLDKHDFTSQILDLNLYHEMHPQRDIAFLRQILLHEHPKIVGISSTSYNYPEAVEVARAVKEVDRKILTVYGGVHATFNCHQILREVKDIDVIGLYEGEEAMLELTQRVMQGETSFVPGTAYREGDQVVLAPPRERITDLDRLPYPGRDLTVIPFEKYFEVNGVKNVALETMRGCPYECIFCSTKALHGHQVRYRSPTKVVDEMQQVIDRYDVDIISFCDDTFTLNKDHVLRICEEVKRQQVKIQWTCSTRVDRVDPEVLHKMRNAGCVYIFYGIETVTPQVLHAIKKGFTPQVVERAIQWTAGSGINYELSFIVGLPRETQASFTTILQFVARVKSMAVHPDLLHSLSGTTLAEHCEGCAFYSSDAFPGINPIFCTQHLSTRQIVTNMVEFYKRCHHVWKQVLPPRIEYTSSTRRGVKTASSQRADE